MVELISRLSVDTRSSFQSTDTSVDSRLIYRPRKRHMICAGIRNMAEARTIPSLGGYDEEFVNVVEEDLHCGICQLPLKDPILTKCGHRCCRQCLDEHFKRLELNRQPLICPVDRNYLIRDKDIFPDKATERKILSFIIRCPSEGCQWTGELRSKDNHLASCPLKVVSCTNKNCHVTLTRNKLQEHVTTSCPWRILQCTFCDVSHPECKTEVHQTECRRLPLNCPQSCGAVIPREEISTHTENDCPLTIISCQYAQMGCTTKILRREAEDHLQSATRLHLDLACVKLNNTQLELCKTQLNLFRTQIELSNTQEEFKETTRKLGEKIDALENTLKESLEENIYNWKIDSFSQVLSQAKSGLRTKIESAPFNRYGYKCQLRLDPYGCGDGENTHLSIFIYVMKGEYDAILPWPFNKKVTFTLIDQQDDATDRENIVLTLIKEPKYYEHLGRPVTDKNAGLGFTKFVSHNKLKDRRYIVNDTVFIQVQVSPLQ